MLPMGRKRKVDNGLEPRVYFSHGAYYYAHRGAGWEHLGVDKDAANRKARIYNDPGGRAGTLVYWLDMFVADCEARVKAGSLAARTLADYRDAIGTDEKPGALRVFFAPPMTPADVTPDQVQDFLEAGAENRATRSNRERAALSSCFGWLLRKKHCPGLMVNPCLRASGVQRNPESKRERYVSDQDYRDVFEVASRSERLMMELTYRTLQRPDSDLIKWDTSVIVNRPDRRTLEFVQNKGKRRNPQRLVIAFSPELEALLPRPAGNVRQLVAEPIIRKLDGGFYTYSGLSSMLRRSIATANVRRQARGLPLIESFGFRDCKGKGATDMWLAEVPIEKIQALCGHKTKQTTEIYVKARWHEAVQPNTVKGTA
ncbi:MAG: Tyrosine recombinase XerC [Variovorax sp.]|nr:Tyrosine recombinase XerC [Variovorax sp.]